jgi:hypothetical protein
MVDIFGTVKYMGLYMICSDCESCSVVSIEGAHSIVFCTRGCIVATVEKELEDGLDLIAFLKFVSGSSVQMSRTYLYFLFL